MKGGDRLSLDSFEGFLVNCYLLLVVRSEGNLLKKSKGLEKDELVVLKNGIDR
jgi:hypothetical protein